MFPHREDPRNTFWVWLIKLNPQKLHIYYLSNMFLGLPGICLCVAQTVTIFDKFKILASCPNLRIRDDSEIANFWHCKSKFQPFFYLWHAQESGLPRMYFLKFYKHWYLWCKITEVLCSLGNGQFRVFRPFLQRSLACRMNIENFLFIHGQKRNQPS